MTQSREDLFFQALENVPCSPTQLHHQSTNPPPGVFLSNKPTFLTPHSSVLKPNHTTGGQCEENTSGGVNEKKIVTVLKNPWFIGLLVFLVVVVGLSIINPPFLHKTPSSPKEPEGKLNFIPVLIIAGLAGLATPLIPLVINAVRRSKRE
jgi:hypothetical protein